MLCLPVYDITLFVVGFAIASILWLVVYLNTGSRNDGNGF